MQCATDLVLLKYLLDAHIENDGWKIFLSQFIETFNCSSAHMTAISTDKKSMKFHVHAGTTFESKFANSFIEKYLGAAPELQQQAIQKPCAFQASNLSQYGHTINNSDYFQEWLKPQGIEHFALACIHLNEQWICAMAINRTKEQGGFSEDEISKINQLLPYVRKQYEANLLESSGENNTSKLQSLVNSYRLPVAIFSTMGELDAMNQPMKLILDKQQAIKLQHKTYHLDPGNDLAKGLVKGVLKTLKQKDGVDVNEYPVSKIDTSFHYQELTHDFSKKIENENAENNITRITPITPQNKAYLGVMVYATTTDYSTTLSPSKLQSIFSLTPTESKVCAAIASGHSANEISERYSKSIHTIREHIKSCLVKTQCSSQVALVNLISSIPIH